MDCWAILGMERSDDKKAIAAAYRSRLALVHPEEHPQEFMELRAAYEEALDYANKAAFAEEEEILVESQLSDAEKWQRRLDGLYTEFSKRVDPACWRELLADPICQSLDSRMECEQILLIYLMEHFYLPASIWGIFNAEFGFSSRVEELCERYPRQFIESIANAVEDSESIGFFDYFAPDTHGNPDAFLDLFFKTRQAIMDDNSELARQCVEDMEKTGVKHPYLPYAKARLLQAQERHAEARELMEPVLQEFPDSLEFKVFYAELLLDTGSVDEALILFKEVLEERPKDFSARLGQANCLREKGELSKARDKYIELSNETPYDNSLNEILDDIIARLHEENEKKFEADKDDFETVLEYAWVCLQSEEYDKAKEVIALAKPEGPVQRADYENFSTKLYINAGEPEEALVHAQRWLDCIPELPEGETEEEKKRKGKPGEITYLQASALLDLKRYDEAIAKALESEALRPKEVVAADVRRRAYLAMHRYDDAVREARRMVEIQSSLLSYYFLGSALYDCGLLREAYDAFEKGLRYSSDYSTHVMMIRILRDCGQYEQAQAEIDYLREYDCNTDCLEFLQANLKQVQGDDKGPIQVYRRLQKKEEKGDCDIFFAHELYNVLAEAEEEKLEPKEILRLVDKGLSIKEDYVPLQAHKGFLLQKLGRPQEALELYLQMIQENPRQYRAYLQVANIYYEELDDYANALLYFKNYREACDDAHTGEMIALCHMYLLQYQEAEAEFKRAIELDPSRARSHSNLGLLYERQFDFERSLPLQEEAAALNCALPAEQQDPSIYPRFARCLCRAGRRREAIQLYQENIKRFHRYADAKRIIEVCILDMDLCKAEELLRCFFDPARDPKLYFEKLSDIRMLQGDERDYLRCLEALPGGDGNKYCKLAEFYAERGKLRRAEEFYAKMLRCDDNDQNLLCSYAFYLQGRGLYSEAAEVADQALSAACSMEGMNWQMPLCQVRKAMAYIGASRFEEAAECIRIARTQPLCDFCLYSRCKDAHLAQAYLEYAKGEFEAARRTCMEGAGIAPDEADFGRLIAKMKREGRI